MMKKKQVNTLVRLGASFVFVLPVLCSGQTLIQAYDKGLKFDSTYLQAQADFMASKESKRAAWAAFLPQISTTGNFLTNYQDNVSNEFSVNASQTIFNWASIRQISQAKAQVRQAVENVSAKEQDLMQRVTSAYLGVVRTNELLIVTKEQLQAMRKQLRAVHERYKVGHATITDIDRVKATYDLYRSQLMTAKMNLNTEIQRLSEITGMAIRVIPRLKHQFKLLKPQPLNVHAWLERVKTQNLNIKAAEEGVLAAKAAVGVQRGAYFPTVSVTGSYYPEKVANTDKQFIYGLSVSYNAFQGGYSTAEVGRAQADYQKAIAVRDGAYRTAISSMQRSYMGMYEGVSQLSYERLAVSSNTNALKHTEEGYIAGTQTILDVLDQQNKLFEAQKTYITGRVNYLNNIVRLEQAAGILKPKVLIGLQRWLS